MKRGDLVYFLWLFFLIRGYTPPITRISPNGRRIKGRIVRIGDLNAIWISAVMFFVPSRFMMNQMYCSWSGRYVISAVLFECADVSQNVCV